MPTSVAIRLGIEGGAEVKRVLARSRRQSLELRGLPVDGSAGRVARGCDLLEGGLAVLRAIRLPCSSCRPGPPTRRRAGRRCCRARSRRSRAVRLRPGLRLRLARSRRQSLELRGLPVDGSAGRVVADVLPHVEPFIVKAYQEQSENAD
jgi:hypothetical protein